MQKSSNMARRYSILHKKLEELESQLEQVVSFPSDTPCHQLLAYDIRQRFSFFNNLLSAEKTASSRPGKPPRHLHRIARKLAELESVFCAWDELTTAAPPDRAETGSKCSCTESCLNDEGGDGYLKTSSLADGNLEDFLEGEGGEKKAAAGEAERDEGKSVLMGGRCGVLVVGMALLSLVILTFSSVDDTGEFYLTPT